MSHFSSRAAMVAVLFAAACRPGVAEPERALEQFLGHVQRGRANDAWNALTAESQAQLRAQAATLAEATGQPPTDDVDEILFDQMRLRAPAKPDTIVVVGPLGERVRLRVSMPDDGRSAELWMVNEDGRWKVDLVGSLIARAPATGADRAPTPAPPDLPDQPPSGEPDDPNEALDQPADADAGDRATATPPASQTDGRPDTNTPNANKP